MSSVYPIGLMWIIAMSVCPYFINELTVTNHLQYTGHRHTISAVLHIKSQEYTYKQYGIYKHTK